MYHQTNCTMKRTSMYVIAGIAFTLVAAGCNSNQSGNENRQEAENELEELTGDVKEEVNEVFSNTRNELAEETAELKKEANQLREEIQENQLEPADSAINRYLAQIDEGIQGLEIKAREFEAASEQRREQIKKEIDKLENDVSSALERLENELEES